MEEKLLSCEQFVIHDLLEARKEIENLRLLNDDLKNKIGKIESVECKTINNSGVYYKISETTYRSDFERLSKVFSLKEIKSAIELAEQDIFEDLDKIRNHTLGYGDYIAKCKTQDYTHIIVHGGYKFVINISSNGDSFDIYSYFIDNIKNFLDKEEAEKQAIKIAIENLKEYVEWYEEKHKEDEE